MQCLKNTFLANGAGMTLAVVMVLQAGAGMAGWRDETLAGGTYPPGHAQLFAPNPVQSGSRSHR